jgi:prepilin-type N-terminal cleavage/methylation domain-containing protein
MRHYGRAGLSLVELLVVIAITGILMALVCGAVMKAREVALRVQSSSQLREIVLALHHCADARAGLLPSLGDMIVPPQGNVSFENDYRPSLFTRLLPYVEEKNVQHGKYVSLFVSPADPTAGNAARQLLGVSSYAANGDVFRREWRLNVAFRDGSSNTIAFAEHYSTCDFEVFYYSTQSGSPLHRASFADQGDIRATNYQLYPLVTVVPPRTYQVAPAVSECNPGFAQTPHASGMLVALGMAVFARSPRESLLLLIGAPSVGPGARFLGTIGRPLVELSLWQDLAGHSIDV